MAERISEEYKLWRAAVVKRDKHRCRFPGCKRRTKIEVHHIIPWSRNTSLRFEVSNGICLCRYHHKQIKGKEGYYIGMFISIVGSK